jgi:[protein-PII] uridylyltransferase
MPIVKADSVPPLLDEAEIADTIQKSLRVVEKTDQARRAKLLSCFKHFVEASRKQAEAYLLEDGGGLACVHRLSQAQDCLIRQIYDAGVNHLYRHDNPSDAERIAICAVGGYGRGTLAPGSDIDLLFLRPYKQTPWGEQILEHILYLLWDLGFKVGHATRTVEECLRLAKEDMTIRTALLESRLIHGDEGLFEDLQKGFENSFTENAQEDFIEAKLAERDVRHRKQGTSRYLVEPNVKESKGGLRDLNTLYWIGKYYHQVSHPSELVKAGVFTRSEYNRFQKCEDFLWATRCHLHFITKRAEERLSFDVQAEIAQRLGYTSHPGLRDVERFMKHYFLTAKDVGDLTRIVCANIEEREGRSRPLVEKVISTLSGTRRKTLKETNDFVVEHGRLNVTRQEVFEQSPVNLIRFFYLADQHELALHPDTMRLITRSLKLIDKKLRDSPKANALFLEILTSKHDPERILRRMNEAGVLGRFVPEFGKVVAMMQFNMYHHYTVDEHLLRSIGVLAEIDRGNLGDEHPLADEIFSAIHNRRVLYVALFLHDIAKGRPEDHSIAGARIARKLGPRFGLNETETALAEWLVQEHLTMSMTAQSRDLSDRKTIADFAACVQTIERLRLLLVLTVADIKAVGPGVWNGWKGQLLRTLYYETETFLSGGHSKVERTARVEHAKSELADMLRDWSDDDIKNVQNLHHAPYWLRVDLSSRKNHAELLRDTIKHNRTFSGSIECHAFEGVTEITVLAPDHTRLLAHIAGACAMSGANIVDAQIHTTKDGRALDTIRLRREFPSDYDEERRAERILQTIEKAVAGTIALTEKVAAKSGQKTRSKPFKLPPEIMIDNSSSDHFTVIEAAGIDRTGLLYDLTSELANLSLDIGSAHVATFGERAVDTFYVTDLKGQKITDTKQINLIKARLEDVFRSKPDSYRGKEKKA